MLTSIAWRNLWRNRRRTIITLVAIGGGMTMMVFMYGMVNAMADRMIEGLTGSYIGHVQIHQEGYRSKRGKSKTIADAELVLDAVRATKGVVAATGRVYGFSHASFVRGDDEVVRNGGGEDISSPVVALLGVEPEHETNVTDLEDRLSEGRWLEGPLDVVIGASLAKRIGARIGDAFVPTVVDRTGAMRGPWAVSEQVPRVVGIVRTGMEQIDGRMAIMPREYLAQLMRMEGEIHEVAIRADDANTLDALAESLRQSVAEARTSVGASTTLSSTTPMVIMTEDQSGDDSTVGDRDPDAGVPSDGAPSSASAPLQIRLVGVDPSASEETAENGAESLTKGRFLVRSDDIVLSRSTAAELEVELGERINLFVPMDCGDDVPEAECPPSEQSFVVAGLIEPQPIQGSQLGLITTAALNDNVASLAPEVVSDLTGEDATRLIAFASGLRGETSAHDEVLPWYDLEPGVRDMLAMMDVGPIIFLVIMFIAVFIGIVNTLLMATFERTKELGLMRAMGMRPYKIVMMIMAESAQLAVVGILCGLVMGLSLIAYLSVFGLDLGVFMSEEGSYNIQGIVFDPMVYPRIEVRNLITIIIPISIMTTLAGLYPAIRAARLQPTEALRHE